MKRSWNKGTLLKTATKITKVLTSIFAPTCAAILLTACGGSGPEPYLANSASANKVKTSTTSAAHNASASGLNSSEKFEGFNPPIWNEHMWYECNCGINPNTPPKAAPQDGLLLGNLA
jgi:hypothetical protein